MGYSLLISGCYALGIELRMENEELEWAGRAVIIVKPPSLHSALLLALLSLNCRHKHKHTTHTAFFYSRNVIQPQDFYKTKNVLRKRLMRGFHLFIPFGEDF